jgi:hypothetical protein
MRDLVRGLAFIIGLFDLLYASREKLFSQLDDVVRTSFIEKLLKPPTDR